MARSPNPLITEIQLKYNCTRKKACTLYSIFTSKGKEIPVFTQTGRLPHKSKLTDNDKFIYEKINNVWVSPTIDSLEQYMNTPNILK